MINSHPLPVLDALQPTEFAAAIARRQAFKVHGLIQDWDAMRWTFKSLRAQLGSTTVKVLVDLPRAGGVLPGGQDSYESTMSFGQFVERIFQPEAQPCYLGYARADDLLRGVLSADFDFASLTLADSASTDTRLWIGSAHTCSGLHSDLKDNVFAQIVGTKRVYIVPFSQTRLTYPFIDNIVNSEVDPEHFDAARFPKFIRATVYKTVVFPGEVLFIPRGWWHYLKSESPSISINHWFGEPVSSRSYMALLMKLGPRYVSRAVWDMVRYSVLRRTYRKDFFFTPQSTGERLFNFLRHGDFSLENDPVKKQ